MGQTKKQQVRDEDKRARRRLFNGEEINLASVVRLRLGSILGEAQSMTDEEISYSDVVRVLLNMAHDKGRTTSRMLGKLVCEETI